MILLDTRRKLNVHKSYVRSIYVLCLRGIFSSNEFLFVREVFFDLRLLQTCKENYRGWLGYLGWTLTVQTCSHMFETRSSFKMRSATCAYHKRFTKYQGVRNLCFLENFVTAVHYNMWLYVEIRCYTIRLHVSNMWSNDSNIQAHEAGTWTRYSLEFPFLGLNKLNKKSKYIFITLRCWSCRTYDFYMKLKNPSQQY